MGILGGFFRLGKIGKLGGQNRGGVVTHQATLYPNVLPKGL